MATYRETVRALQPAIEPIFKALQTGLDEANQDHASRGFRRSDDPHYYAHLARRVACDQLMDDGFQALNEDTGRPMQSLSGLLVFYQDVALRIFRAPISRSGNIVNPIPGRSLKRQQFWRQDPAIPDMETDNIVLLWRDEDGVLLEPMRIFRPIGGNHRRNSLQLSWQGKLFKGMANMRAEDLDLLRADVEYPDMGTGQTG